MRVGQRRGDATLSHVPSPSGPAGAHAQRSVEEENRQEQKEELWRGGVVIQRGVRVSSFPLSFHDPKYRHFSVIVHSTMFQLIGAHARRNVEEDFRQE